MSTYNLHFGSNKNFIHQLQKLWYDETVKLLNDEHVKSKDITLVSDLALEMFAIIL